LHLFHGTEGQVARPEPVAGGGRWFAFEYPLGYIGARTHGGDPHMCHRTTCRTCNKPTWAGCGNHIEMALAGVPKSQRCSCTTAQKASQPQGGFLSRLFG